MKLREGKYIEYRAGMIFSLSVLFIYTLPGVVSWLCSLFACLIALYWQNYHTNYGKISLVSSKKDSKFSKFLDKYVPTLKKAYSPTYWCAESRAITILRYFIPCRKPLEWEKEILKVEDGGLIGINWVHNDISQRFPDPNTRPTVIIVPGLSSTIESGYIKSMSISLIEQGFRVAVMVYRGLEGIELKTPKTYCATSTSDLATVVDVVKKRYPKSKLYSIGASLGSLILGRYMSEMGDDVTIDAGMLLSCSFHPPICMEEFESWSNKIFLNLQVTHGLKEMYRRHSHVFESVVDHKKVENSVFLRDWDTHFTVPVFGYESTEEYFHDSILCEERLKDIKRPLLCVNSNDDPFSPERALPKNEVARTENVALVMTYGGGHVSHLEGWNPFSKSYYEKIMIEYFNGMVENTF